MTAAQAGIDRLLADALDGRSGALVLRGEHGSGKTALCDAAAAAATGMTVLHTRAVEDEAGLPFAALADLLRPVLGHLDAIPEPQAAALRGALALGPAAAGDRFTVCAATLSMLAAAAEAAPLLAIVDDAQWLDPASAEALLFAARRLDAEGVAVLLATLAAVPGPIHPGALPEERLAGGGESVDEDDLSSDTATTVVTNENDLDLEAAACDARARRAHAVAARSFERAARVATLPERRARLFVEAADDLRRAGENTRALELLRAALPDIEDAGLRADARHLEGVVEIWRGEPLAAHRILVEAARPIEESHPAKAAMMLVDATWPCFLGADLDLGLETARRACAVAETARGPVEILANVLLAEALILRGDSDSGTPLLELCRPLLEHPGSVAEAAQLIEAAAHVFVWLEEYETAARLLSLVIEHARRESSPGMLPYALATESELDFRTGRWAAATAAATEAVRLAAETDQASALTYGLVSLARIEAAQGREAECRAHVARALELAAFGVRAMVVFGSSDLGLLELGLGRVDAAIDHLQRVARAVERAGAEEPAVVQWGPDLVEAYIRSGRIADAERELAVFERRAIGSRRTWALAAAARLRGLLAPEAGFESEFEEALRWHDRTATPFERARTELCLGERYRRGRRRGDARRWLRSALETFERLGAEPWAERVRQELSATGESVPRRAGPDAHALTPQELQVALVVARGATNREAGAALFLSPKTIETHLGRVYRKLGVRSRTELAHLLAAEAAALEPAPG